MTYEIEEKQIDPRHTATIRFRTPPGPAMGAKLAEVLPEIMSHLKSAGVEVTGPPFSLYRGMANGTFDLEAGMPVGAPIKEAAQIKPGTLPGGKAAVTWHVGPYDTLGNAFEAVEKWRRERGYSVRGSEHGPWEVYWTDPGEEIDPAKWRTEVIWPID
jgi:effector-binding domain-containing protein